MSNAKLLNFLGGEEAVHATAPLVYEALRNVTTHENLLEEWDGMGIPAYSSIEIFHCEKAGIRGLLRSTFNHAVSFLVVTGTVYDHKKECIAGTFNYFFENTRYEEIPVLLDSSRARQAYANGLCVVATFTWSHDGNTTHEYTQELKVPAPTDGEVIKSIDITAPKAKNKTMIKVLYDRGGTEEADYCYHNVVSQDRTSTKVKMPFKGQVKVDSGFEIMNVMTVSEAPKLALAFQNGHTAIYKNPKGIVGQFSVSESRDTLAWDFDDDWFDSVSLETLSAYTIASLIVQFTLTVRRTDGSGTIYNPMITIFSKADNLPGAAGVPAAEMEIECIQIQWGCLAEETLIKMADWSVKPAKSICVGDLVKNGEGHIATIQQVIFGVEDELVYLETMNGHKLMATRTHPVATVKGFRPLDAITASDIIRTEDGDSQVRHIYPKAYENMVYNFVLEPSGSLICGGIIAGDFVMENTNWHGREQLQPTPLQLQLRESFEAWTVRLAAKEHI